MLKGYSLLERICTKSHTKTINSLFSKKKKKNFLCTAHYIMDLFNFQVCLLVGNATCFI